jgi:mono/diheme cytochrome c family protein
MRPGEACIACHALGYAGPVFAFAGTVYNRGHEPDDCNGVLPAEGIVVEITDANNVKTKLHTNNAGNFMLLTPVALPYTARVLSALGERRMLTPQTSGDCNSCHSSAGKNGAPGRIAIP